ncbi:hypothetical protein [Novosphingobium mangrovi (ex Huang et al. 2023)]|uniref:Uncharacterized protein n=1 Tax=Novosphingobium mangrovi (ex Huang et al. 2023) TaxID=2976432 RepID=A0ABT2IA60_9SPHN|nr:hypothetical protein [Novosphingobium mangrovi (ex Huang et al. 2023)]MCT2401715.1 hypothetical protein [Novosphingobium mangrovi (ex Huang et al. 2023)]
MRALMAAALCLLFAAPVSADTVTIIGIGNDSCATAFLPNNVYQTKAWIFGFWSARNSEKGANVGSTTDSNGIIGEVESTCRKFPSYHLIVAVGFVYDMMEADNR